MEFWAVNCRVIENELTWIKITATISRKEHRYRIYEGKTRRYILTEKKKKVAKSRVENCQRFWVDTIYFG